MRIIKIVYNKESNFIVDIVEEFKSHCILEFYNINKRQDMKKARVIQEDMGTKNLPLIAIEDENFELVGGIYSESKPNWRLELISKLNLI